MMSKVSRNAEKGYPLPSALSCGRQLAGNDVQLAVIEVFPVFSRQLLMQEDSRSSEEVEPTATAHPAERASIASPQKIDLDQLHE